MIDHQTTLELVEKAKNGCEESKSLLLQHNSPLIKSLIKRFLNKGVEYADLFQIASIGLLKAIKNFDVAYNVKFSTYVVPLVIGEIKRFMRDDGAIKVSRTIKTLNLKIRRYVDDYTKENHTKPTTKQIATQFKIDESEVVFTMDSANMPVSIYTQLEGSDSNLMLIDRIEPEENAQENLINNLSLKQTLMQLCERDRKIILLRFFRDKTQSEIAKILNVSQVQVSRLENKVLEKIKEKMSVI